ncbi:MAG: L,D-transpeptidase [Candidatus Nanopelagicaceae bacterium]
MKQRWFLISILAIAALGGLAKFGFDYFYFEVANREVNIIKPTGPVTPLPLKVEIPASSPAKPTPEQVQQAIADLGIPVGEIDGKWGKRTRQGFCIWRELTGRSADRNYPIEIEQYAIINTKRLVIPKDFVVGLNVSKACQSAVWVKDRARDKFQVTIASTGAQGFETGDGVFKVTWKVDRWYESIAYPDGWMYRPMFFNAGEAIHGSEFDQWVWWYPASHGCVRLLGAFIDELWAAGFAEGSKIYVYGTWNPITEDPREF